MTAVLTVLIAGSPTGASAQAVESEDGRVNPGRVALMPSASLDPTTRELATALDPVLLAQLESVTGIKAAARPALDLPAMELALDCVGETPECLRAVLRETGTDSLLAPSVQIAGEETVVTLLYFDPRAPSELRSVVRRHRGPDVDVHRAMLDGVPAMLRELFGLAEPVASEPDETEGEPPIDDGDIEPAVEPSDKPFPLGPVIVGGVGVVLIGAGIAFGLAANSSEEDWKKQDPETRGQVGDAYDIYDRGQTQALLSNIGFVVGGAALATGVIWLALELSSDEPGTGGEVALTPQLGPRLGPGTLGVSWHGSL